MAAAANKKSPFWAFFVLIFWPFSAIFADTIWLDTELDTWFQQLTAPLLSSMPQAKNANPSIRFVLVANPAINAYVTPNNIIHIHSGLIEKADNAAEIQGVLAHELGHIDGQHISQLNQQATTAGWQTAAGALLGVGAIAAGAPSQAGAAIIMTSQASAVSGILSFSRTQEAEADRRAVTALHANHFSAQPMLKLFNKLYLESQLSIGSVPDYLLTHPLPARRISALQQSAQTESFSPTTLPALSQQTFQRIQAKSYALSHSPAETLRHFTNNTPTHQYARSLAYLRQGNHAQASQLLHQLLQNNPTDAFYQETLGQLEFEAGNLTQAALILNKVLQNNPQFIYTRYLLAETYRGLNQPQKATPLLEDVTRNWPQWPTPWQSLSLAYGQNGHYAKSHLALAEYFITQGQKQEALQQIGLAQHYFKQATTSSSDDFWLKDLQQRINSSKP